MKPTAALKKQMQSGNTVVAIGAYDAFSARIVEQAGFDAVYVGSYATEAAALGKPVVTGPHLFSTQEIGDMFLTVGASIMVNDERELATAVLDLLADPDKAAAAGEKGFELMQQNRGALQRLLDLLEPTMNGVSTYPGCAESSKSSHDSS